MVHLLWSAVLRRMVLHLDKLGQTLFLHPQFIVTLQLCVNLRPSRGLVSVALCGIARVSLSILLLSLFLLPPGLRTHDQDNGRGSPRKSY